MVGIDLVQASTVPECMRHRLAKMTTPSSSWRMLCRRTTRRQAQRMQRWWGADLQAWHLPPS